MVFELKGRRRLTSVKRASEPYDARQNNGMSTVKYRGSIGDPSNQTEWNEPRLSAAMTTPSLNFTATTEVPVTAGDWVCVLGPELCRYDASYAP